ncbi:MAG: exodeoxyribonuclease VII large subunit [bacterium]
MSFNPNYRKVLTVSQLNQQLRINLATYFSHLWLEGELTNLATPASGHIYFSLKDSSSQIKAVMFRRQAAYLPFAPRNGLQVLVKGSLDVYAPRGDHQIIVDLLEPKGVGSLRLAFEELCARLKAEGLFDERHKKPLPAYPEKIGLITSPSGAVVHDLVQVIHRRYPCVRIEIYPAAVQGGEAKSEICSALKKTKQQAEPPDLLILARGGGSMEDLAPFNSEEVARAIFGVSIPIISAVGHESDFTIADLTADLRAPTPSAAGELAVRDKQDILSGIREKSIRLVNSREERLSQEKLKQAGLRKRLSRVSPRQTVNDRLQRLSDLQQALERTIRRRLGESKQNLSYLNRDLYRPLPDLSRHRHDLERISTELLKTQKETLTGKRQAFSLTAEHLNALSPLNTLDRGYGLVRDRQGNLIRQTEQIEIGNDLDIILAKGKLDARVTRIYQDNNLKGITSEA